MSYVVETMTNLAAQTGFAFLKPGNFIMILVALVFLYLAIAKGYEPLLLVRFLLVCCWLTYIRPLWKKADYYIIFTY